MPAGEAGHVHGGGSSLQVLQMHPLLGLLIPAATGGDDVQVGVVLAITAMRLDDHDVAARKGAATDPGKDIIQTASPTAHERTQQGLRLLIKRRS